MTETSRYLTILAKVMRTKDLTEDRKNKDKYNKLYSLVETELNSKLKKSQYPQTSDIIQQTKEMLETIETLYLFPEIVGKRCLCVSNYITTNIFDICKYMFKNYNLTSTFKNLYTQIPIVVLDDAEKDSVEVLNYANIRISLTIDELKFLTIESNKRGIALNKIIQLVLVKTELEDTSVCIIADNIYSSAEKIFSRVVSGRLIYVDEKGIQTIGKRRIDSTATLLLSDNVFKSTCNNPLVNRYNRILFSEVSEYIKDKVPLVYYGFWEEYTSIETQIIDYYDKQIFSARNTLQEVVGDIVRLGDNSKSILKSIRSTEEEREECFESEKKDLLSVLCGIEKLVIEISYDLGESVITGKHISRRTLNDFFVSFFRCEKYDSGLGKKLLSRLFSYEYDNQNLVQAYIQSTKGVLSQCNLIDISPCEWEKAKMLIAILEPDEIPNHKLSMYVRALGKHCWTGKELYAKALVSPERLRAKIFLESLNKGYKKAGLNLLEIYHDQKIERILKTLANALVPEACMILADEKISQNESRRRYVNFSDYRFTYYKIAAANQHAPAIGKIVDMVFESGFSSGFQIPASEINNPKYKTMRKNGQVICQLCRYLISKMYNVEHYKEILGITLFSLNENLSEAISLLESSESALALYCKGNMYEFGGGVAVNLKKAVKNYKASLKLEYSERTEKRLAKCKAKKKKAERDDDYFENVSYSSSSEYIGSREESSFCFAPNTQILMADGSYCPVENIKINDIVLAFDHYTGKVCKEKIVANVHDIFGEEENDIINLIFEAGRKLKIVKSHALFDASENQYVWIDAENVELYINHSFACFIDGKLITQRLTAYSVEHKKTRFYMPVSRYHLNLFAEGILTMPPTEITINLFKFKENMCYDLSPVEQYGLTSYDEISQFVSYEEYVNLPCKYLRAVSESRNLPIDEFLCAISLYREQAIYMEKRNCHKF